MPTWQEYENDADDIDEYMENCEKEKIGKKTKKSTKIDGGKKNGKTRIWKNWGW
ncbi:MAG: hypothetical protein ABIG69_11810 [Bacteroidota bacterium]